MTAFTVWGRITLAEQGTFVVAVSATPTALDGAQAASETHPTIAIVNCTTRRDAERQRDMMVEALSRQLRETGHSVLEAELE